MNNQTLLTALSNTNLKEREQWAEIVAYSQEKKAILAHEITLCYFGEVIKAHYRHLLHNDPNFKAFLIARGR